MAVPLGPKYLAGKRAYTNFRDTIKFTPEKTASFAGEKDVGLRLPAYRKGVRPESRTPVLLTYLKHVAYFLAPRFS